MSPVKQKARFKIKDAKCHLRPRNKEKHRDSSKQNLQGKDHNVVHGITQRHSS